MVVRNNLSIFAALGLTAVLSACGGSGSDGVAATAAAAQSGAVASSATTPAAGQMVAASADVRQKVMVLGDGSGFVAKSLSAALPTGNSGDYDILVVRDPATTDAALAEQVKQALASGKEVVIDGDGSKTLSGSALLKEITGSSIEAEAVRIAQDREGRGYYVTPLQTPAKAIARAKAQGLAVPSVEAAQAMNTVENVFGLASNGGAQ